MLEGQIFKRAETKCGITRDETFTDLLLED
jgi:hypothetical protein